MLGQEIYDKICLTTKQRKFAIKVVSRQKQHKLVHLFHNLTRNCVSNYTLWVKLHTAELHMSTWGPFGSTFSVKCQKISLTSDTRKIFHCRQSQGSWLISGMNITRYAFVIIYLDPNSTESSTLLISVVTSSTVSTNSPMSRRSR